MNTILPIMALRNLSRHRSRTVISMVGIVIGVTVVTIVGMLSVTIRVTIEDTYTDIVNKIIILPNPDSPKKINEISYYTYQRIEKMPEISSTSAVQGKGLKVRMPAPPEEYGESTIDSEREDEVEEIITIFGMESEMIEEYLEVEEGRLFRGYSTSCLLGSDFIRNHKHLRVGSVIYIDDHRFTVAGILKRIDNPPELGALGNGIIINNMNFRSITRLRGFMFISVTARDIDEIKICQEELEKLLNPFEEKYVIIAMIDQLEAMQKQMANTFSALWLVAIVSMIVSATAILNVMLVAVMERTREIGVMLAIGAYGGEIGILFLMEAIFMGLLASAIGAICSLITGYLMIGLFMSDIIGDSSPLHYLFMPEMISPLIQGIGMGILVTILSSIYPCINASKISPIEALRRE